MSTHYKETAQTSKIRTHGLTHGHTHRPHIKSDCCIKLTANRHDKNEQSLTKHFYLNITIMRAFNTPIQQIT